MKWSEDFSKIGPILEIGSFCGKSSIYMGIAAQKMNQVVYTIDHHRGSEEHQLNEEYFDSEIYDKELNEVNSFPLFMKNIRSFDLENTIIPIVSSSAIASKGWNNNLGLVFIDGSHSLESATLDYESWKSKIKKGGALVIHDIFEDPNLGGQAPYQIYTRAIEEGFELFERVDTIGCLIKNF
jgi:predicted O-methyltransferase YrrM